MIAWVWVVSLRPGFNETQVSMGNTASQNRLSLS
jgi:hypothetical protein